MVTDGSNLSDSPGPEGRLREADLRGLEALIDASWDLSRVPAGVRDDAGRVAAFLGVLDGWINPDTRASDQASLRTLVDVTMVRAARAADRAQAREWALSPDDQEAMDAWVLAGFDTSRVPSSLRARAQHHEGVRELVTSAPAWSAAERDALIDRTARAVRGAGVTLRFENAPAGRGWNWRDLVSVAAVVLIGASVVWPVASAVRQSALQTACLSNLGSVAGAVGAYSGDYAGSLPVAAASMGGLPWWSVDASRPVANSANLFTLARTGYTNLRALACGGNSSACRDETRPGAWDWRSLGEVSYSYQIMFAADRPAWEPAPARLDADRNPAATVIMADRSPVVLRAVRHEWIYPFENSPNHGGRGQQVLFNDGSAVWAESPVVNGDNIWLPRFIEDLIRRVQLGNPWPRQQPLEGTELPQGRDIFLGP
jgi:hypothetical protein